MAGLLRSLLDPVDKDHPDSVDPALVAALARPFRRFGRVWYRLEQEGVEHLPSGPALIVGNHNSGTAFLEALSAGAGIAEEHPLTGLAHDAVVDAPLFGRLLVRVGAVRASYDAAEVAFGQGRKVVVFPGGNREAFRPWRHRHRVDFGGHRGFVRLALRHSVDIVPWVLHGGHSGFVVVDDGRGVARQLGADRWLRSSTWPLMLGLPWGVALGPWPHLPLPVKVRARFFPPVRLGGYGPEDADDERVVRALYHEVQERLQVGLDELVREARSARWRWLDRR